jgi:hypothetical protein
MIATLLLLPNAQLTGEVMLATLLRVFAGKVQTLLNPVELLVICLHDV